MTTFDELRDQIAADPDLRIGGAVPISVIHDDEAGVVSIQMQIGGREEIIEKQGADLEAAAGELLQHLANEGVIAPPAPNPQGGQHDG